MNLAMAKGPRVSFAAFRDALTFVGGLALLAYEALSMTEPRLEILGLAAAMMGLPGTLGIDRILNRSGAARQADPTDAPSSGDDVTPPTAPRHGRR